MLDPAFLGGGGTAETIKMRRTCNQGEAAGMRWKKKENNKTSLYWVVGITEINLLENQQWFI